MLFRSVEQSLSRLTRLIDKLLQLARAESVSLYTGEPTDTRMIATMVARELNPEGHRVELIGAGAKLPIDPDAIAVVLSNLIENALKYAPDESPVIVNLEEDGQFSVANLAPDLSEADLETLQQRFVRGSQRSKPGSGLGLAIVGTMVEQLQGVLELKLQGKGRGQRLVVKVSLTQ